VFLACKTSKPQYHKEDEWLRWVLKFFGFGFSKRSKYSYRMVHVKGL
jgi:hypothetical protein